MLESLVTVGPGLLAVTPTASSPWLPPRASTVAADVDWMFDFLVYLELFFFVLIVVLMVAFAWMYRRRAGVAPQKSPHHSTTLEVVWTVIPTLLVIYIFFAGVKPYMDMRTDPAGAYEIKVSAFQWGWSFEYPNGYQDENLHVPVNTKVRLTLSARDVLHSLYIPDFRVKHDCVPGRYGKMWFEATQATPPGSEGHHLFCTEYCGRSHSQMNRRVIVHEAGEFEKWLAEAEKKLLEGPPAEVGERLYNRKGCANCHSNDGSAKVGPSFKGTWAQERKFVDGSQTIMDENYVRQSILEPQAKIVAGYQAQNMPSYKGLIKDEEIKFIIEYMKKLGNK